MKYLLVLLALVLSHTSLYSQQIDTKALKAQFEDSRLSQGRAQD